jgi:hypothetical protein
MKLSSMPSSENPRPTLRPPSRSGPATGRRSGNTARRVIRPGEHTAILLQNTPELENNMRTVVSVMGTKHDHDLLKGLKGWPLRYSPALNDSPRHIKALASVLRRYLRGWASGPRIS